MLGRDQLHNQGSSPKRAAWCSTWIAMGGTWPSHDTMQKAPPSWWWAQHLAPFHPLSCTRRLSPACTHSSLLSNFKYLNFQIKLILNLKSTGCFTYLIPLKILVWHCSLFFPYSVVICTYCYKKYTKISYVVVYIWWILLTYLATRYIPMLLIDCIF